MHRLHYQRGALSGSSSSRKRRLLKRSDWTFKTFAHDRWGWHVTHPDGSKQLSAQRFLTRTECVADATLRGYVAWIPEVERRGSK